MDDSLKKMVDEALAFGDLMDSTGIGAARFGTKEKTSRFIRLDMVKFLLYLSVSDNVIAPEEAAFFRDYLGYNFESYTIETLVDKFQLKREDFKGVIPFSFGIMIEADKLILKNTGTNPAAAGALLKVYRSLGEKFIACDNDIAPEETRDLGSYIEFLEKAIDAAMKDTDKE